MHLMLFKVQTFAYLNTEEMLFQEERSWRRERVYKAPLCNSECTQWFEDCKNDMTCVKNWARDFSWFSGKFTWKINSINAQFWAGETVVTDKLPYILVSRFCSITT